MITNERQYRVTKAEINRFEDAIDRFQHEEPLADVHPRLHDAMIDGLRSQVDDLHDQLREYEALREGKIKKRVFKSLLDLPIALIEGRIVRRLTQKELGKRLGLPEQQVQRYEGTRYAGVSLDRLQEVADAVGITLKKTIEYDSREPAQRRTGTVEAARRRSQRGRRVAATGSSLSRASATGGKAKASKTSSGTPTEGGKVANKRTGKAAASAAGKTLASKSAGKTAKRAAASDLAQVRNQKVTGKAAASAAGKTLASKSASKTAKKAAASDLSQAARKKR
jgi:transcriptional regulator with XRE-family HTH domain